MSPAALADVVVALHVSFLAFAGLGALLVSVRPAVAWLHLPALAWGAASVGVGLECPLTGLEKWLRRAGGEQPYSGGFVDRYLENVVLPDDLTPVLWAVAAALSLVVYGTLLARRHSTARRSSSQPGPTTAAPTARHRSASPRSAVTTVTGAAAPEASATRVSSPSPGACTTWTVSITPSSTPRRAAPSTTMTTGTGTRDRAVAERT